MKMRHVFVLILLVMPFLSGCWSRTEINDLAVVTAVGIDKVENDKIRVALQLAIPRLLGPAGQGGGGGGGGQGIGSQAVWIVSEKGETIMDAYRNLQQKLPRKIFFSHSNIIVIGEPLARSGISPVLDFFTRYREVRMRNYIILTRGEALKIVKFSPKFEKIPAEIIREEVELQIGPMSNVRDFVDMLMAEGVEPMASEIALMPSNVTVGEESAKRESPGKEETNLTINGAGIFKKDQLIGWMNVHESRGVLWLRNEINAGVITVPMPEDKGNGKVSVQFFRTNTKIKPILKDDQLKIQVKVRADADLYENSSKLDLSNPKAIQIVEQTLEEDIQNRIQSALDKAQRKFKSDIFGFGREVERAYPKEWENKFKERWDQEFPRLKVTITTDVTVLRTGLTNKSPLWEEKEFKK
ncbi:Ger(x)C family spore germination protein [Ammoniphilus sp. 3BR4]|uniref:Ger(x)C family spore germination protein n=1 Tax=Ammoniphilus sp. 3BR4 TaxID=3158265 RepID=UPI0034678A3F